MDQVWVNELMESLGGRYRLGNPQDGGCALLYRFGKAEFRPTRMVVGAGDDGKRIDLVVDFRVPRNAEIAAAEPLLFRLEERSLAPRGFVRIGEETAAMTTESGKEAGFVRSVRFQRSATEPKESAKAIRAFVESIDLPVVLGVHDLEHMVARDPIDAPKKLGRPLEPMEKWEYTLTGGVLKSLTAVVDPNDRTLVVVERKLVSTKAVSEKIMLAHVAKFVVGREGNVIVLKAEKKDGGTIDLARSPYHEGFVATVERMSTKVLIPMSRN